MHNLVLRLDDACGSLFIRALFTVILILFLGLLGCRLSFSLSFGLLTCELFLVGLDLIGDVLL